MVQLARAHAWNYISLRFDKGFIYYFGHMLFRRIKLEKLQDSAQVQMARIENLVGTRVRVPRDEQRLWLSGPYENFFMQWNY